MICAICGEHYFRGYYGDPENCRCGENAGWTDCPWRHDGWRGVINWLRYRVFAALLWATDRLDTPYWRPGAVTSPVTTPIDTTE